MIEGLTRNEEINRVYSALMKRMMEEIRHEREQV